MCHCVILTVTPHSSQFFPGGFVVVTGGFVVSVTGDFVVGHTPVVLCITQLSLQIMVKHIPEPMYLFSNIVAPIKMNNKREKEVNVIK